MIAEQTLSFGYWVRRRRKALDLTQASLANQVGCATITIKKIESDARRPSRTMAERLADCLRIPEEERETFILGGLGEIPIYVMPLTSKPVDNEQVPDDLTEKQVSKSAVSSRQYNGELARTSSPTHNLPAQPTPFVGRDVDLADLDALSSNPDVRLITIVGPGGIGKTRLAVAFGERVVERMQALSVQETQRFQSFTDGVFFVDLTPLSGVNQIVLAIAEALNIRFQGGSGPEKTPRQQLITYLSDKRMLFIMDNFEQLLVGIELVVEILQRGPGIQVLATSRERLKLRQEQIYPIPTLDYGDWETPEEATEFSAVKIFIQAAHRIRPEFELTSDDLADMTTICRLLGGIPLALELAAGWVELLPMSEIAKEIKRGLSFLSTELLDVPDRHRSMRAVLNATWDRLGSAEEVLVEKLSVFRGGFTREAATKVIADQHGPDTSLQFLASLVSKSVIKVNPDQERYQIHELMRQYAYERLVEAGGFDDTRTAHSIYFTEFLRQGEAELQGRRHKDVLEKIDADFANIRAAWEWALSQGNLTTIVRSLNGLCMFSSSRGRHLEGLDLIRMAETCFASDPDKENNKAWRRIAISRIYLDQDVWSGDLKEKLDEAERILAAAKADGDRAELAFVLLNLGWLQSNLDLDVSLNYLEDSLAIYRQLNDSSFEMDILFLMSFVYLSRGQIEERENNAQQALELARKTGHQLSIAFALGEIALGAEISGLYSEAESKYQDASVIFNEMDVKHWGSENTTHIGWLAFLKGDFDRARALITEGLMQTKKYNLALSMHKAQGMLGMLCNLEEQYALATELCKELAGFVSYWAFGGLLGMVYASCGLGNYSNARSYLLKAIELARLINALGWQTQCLPAAAFLKSIDGQNERATEILALAFQHPASSTGWLLEFPLVVRLRSILENGLTHPVFEAAWERGKRLNLEDTLTTFVDNTKPLEGMR